MDPLLLSKEASTESEKNKYEKADRCLQAIGFPIIEELESTTQKRSTADRLSDVFGFVGLGLGMAAFLSPLFTKSDPTIEVRLWSLAAVAYNFAWWMGRRRL